MNDPILQRLDALEAENKPRIEPLKRLAVKPHEDTSLEDLGMMALWAIGLVAAVTVLWLAWEI